ncbi:hypothetical protein [Lysinibacter cavernae]|uniref:Type VII secretion integral membrane protein EccD n=1 Tax=Lysinibacter cavernae TaxID=1640652 RepID=A0A7X5TU41_9MICO|nr:hypothetical protein [Lysinibacter cavernae]NIH53978.1 hypothetical protein [Lysinibacter cavernae]
MGASALERCRVVVAHGKVRSDISIPSNVPLGDTLNFLGIVPAGAIVLLPNGSQADLSLAPENGSSGGVADGTLLTIVTGNGAETLRRAAHPLVGSRATHGRAVWLFVAVLAGLTVTTAWLNTANDHGSIIPATVLSFVAAAFGIAACIAAISSTRSPVGTVSVSALTVPPLLAFCAGFVAIPPSFTESLHLAMFCGLLGATVAAAAVHLLRAQPLRASSTGLVLTTLAIMAGLWGITLQLGIPQTFAAALVAGFAPLALRILPSLCLDVDDGQLVEYDQFMGAKWTVRGATPAASSSVTEGDVAQMLNNARSQLATGTVLFSVLPVALIPVVLTSVVDAPIERIGSIVLVVCIIASFALTPRRASAPLQRWVPRAAAAALLAQLAALGFLSLSDSGKMMATFLTLGIGLGMVAAVVPVSKGVRSLGLSRFADAVESLATALALPAACAAASLVEIVRGMVSS